jgi:hypothetical protein
MPGPGRFFRSRIGDVSLRQQHDRGRTPKKEDHYVAGISKKIKEAAMHAAKDRLSGSKKGKHGGRSGSGADKAKSVPKSFLK